MPTSWIRSKNIGTVVYINVIAHFVLIVGISKADVPNKFQVTSVSLKSSQVYPKSQFQASWLRSVSRVMHRCLLIQELLSIIFHHAHARKTLARLARTCKTFQDPALDILWCTQDTLLYLLKCLPCDAWVFQMGNFVSDIPKLIGSGIVSFINIM